MKYIRMVFCAALIFILSESVHSQTLTFCEKVDESGNPINAKTLFTIDKNKGGIIKFHVKLPYSIGTDRVVYEIYKVAGNGAEAFVRSINQDVSPDKMWFYTDSKFTNDGSYNIKVYDGQSNHLVTGHLTIQYQ